MGSEVEKPDDGAVAGAHSAFVFELDGSRRIRERQFVDFEFQSVECQILPAPAPPRWDWAQTAAHVAPGRQAASETRPTFAPTSIRVPSRICARRKRMSRESGIRVYITAEDAWQSGKARNLSPLNRRTSIGFRTARFQNCQPKNRNRRLTRCLRFDSSRQIRSQHVARVFEKGWQSSCGATAGERIVGCRRTAGKAQTGKGFPALGFRGRSR